MSQVGSAGAALPVGEQANLLRSISNNACEYYVSTVNTWLPSGSPAREGMCKVPVHETLV